MKENLVNYLACPRCGKDFRLNVMKKRSGEILDGVLTCNSRHRFYIKGGIPRLLLGGGSNTRTFEQNRKSFSSKWKRYHRLHLTKKWTDVHDRWFLQRFGWMTKKKFRAFLNTRSMILDAGTGVGSGVKILAHNPKSQVFAIDAADGIDFAYKQYGSEKNIHFIQADIMHLPFKKGFFDFIVSDQVLHHTKNTARSFMALTELLDRNGMISIYVYKVKGPMREFADDLIRKSTVNMTQRQCREFSRDMAVLGKHLTKISQKITIPRDIPLLKIKAGTYDVQKFVYWNFLKCYYSIDMPLEHSVAVNYDWYFPEYAHRHTPEQVRKWFADVKLKITHFDEIESGISVTGKKHILLS